MPLSGTSHDNGDVLVTIRKYEGVDDIAFLSWWDYEQKVSQVTEQFYHYMHKEDDRIINAIWVDRFKLTVEIIQGFYYEDLKLRVFKGSCEILESAKI